MRISDWSSTCALPICRTVDVLRLQGKLALHPGHIVADHEQNRLDQFRPGATKGASLRQRNHITSPTSARRGHRQGRRSEERRVGKECVGRVDLGGRRIIKTKKKTR